MEKSKALVIDDRNVIFDTVTSVLAEAWRTLPR